MFSYLGAILKTSSKGVMLPKWLLLGSWGVTVLWLSLTPRPPQIHQGLLGWDKFQHAIAYGMLTAFAGSAFKSVPQQSFGRHPWCWAFLIALGFGGLVELLQGLMALGRSAEFADLLADGCGAAAVCLFARYLARSRETK